MADASFKYLKEVISQKGQKQPPELFYKKGVVRNFAKCTGKHLCQSHFLNKVGSRPATLLKQRLCHRCFPVNFAKFLRTFFLQNTSGRLRLKRKKMSLLSILITFFLSMNCKKKKTEDIYLLGFYQLQTLHLLQKSYNAFRIFWLINTAIRYQ